jgi:hypothetical protein
MSPASPTPEKRRLDISIENGYEITEYYVAMTRNVQFVGTLFIGGIVGMLTTGCLGPRVLEERTEHLPAPNPQVELRLKRGPPADVLVLYNEQEPKSGKVTRRAFYLFANEKRVMEGKRPIFVAPGGHENHAPIPILKERPADPKAIPRELYAVSPSLGTFELWSHERTLVDFELPSFGNWLTAKKFFLFPLAAAADAVGVGAAAGAEAVVSAAVAP